MSQSADTPPAHQHQQQGPPPNDAKLMAAAEVLYDETPFVSGVIDRTAVRFVRGDVLVETAILSTHDALAHIQDEAAAKDLVNELLGLLGPRLLLGVEKVKDKAGKPRRVQGKIALVLRGDPRLRPTYSSGKDRFAWLWAPEKKSPKWVMPAVLLGILALVMFPAWPVFMKVGVWYLSVTLLIALFGLLAVRYSVFLVSWTAGYSVWIFPNLFHEELGPIESFQPALTVDRSQSAASTRWLRIGMAGVLIGCAVWVARQPDKWDEWREQQAQFVSELYSGNILTDSAAPQTDGEPVHKRASQSMPSLDDLLADLDSQEEGAEEGVNIDELVAQTSFEEDGVDGLSAEEDAAIMAEMAAEL